MRVAQGGINFSGGQRQRLAIARAVIRRPAIYLFDDSFGALDVHTDARVRASLRQVSGEATIIVVTQRVSTAAQADQVIVVDGGKLVGTGTHEVAAHRLRHLRGVRRLAVGERLAIRPSRGRTMTVAATRGLTPAPVGRSHDFWGSAARLVKRLAPQRRLSIAVISLGITGTAIGVVVPRILGHATDLLFNGVIGRQLPAGITKAQAVAAARARGDNTFADLLSGMSVVPGQGRGLRRGGTNPGAGVGPVSGCRAADLGAGAAAQRHRAAHHGRAAFRCRGQGPPAAAVLLRWTPTR